MAGVIGGRFVEGLSEQGSRVAVRMSEIAAIRGKGSRCWVCVAGEWVSVDVGFDELLGLLAPPVGQVCPTYLLTIIGGPAWLSHGHAISARPSHTPGAAEEGDAKEMSIVSPMAFVRPACRAGQYHPIHPPQDCPRHGQARVMAKGDAN